MKRTELVELSFEPQNRRLNAEELASVHRTMVWQWARVGDAVDELVAAVKKQVRR